MYAAVLHELGQPPRFEEYPDPVPGDGEVLVDMTAVALHPVDRLIASGRHYASPDRLPVVCGVDGVGRLPDGTPVYLGGLRPPYGTMAQRVAVPPARCLPLPDGLAEATAAALVNPGLAAWLPLTWRGRLAAGESVLVLGATGVAGRLAVQLARALGAGRVVAAGRDPAGLATVGADATAALDAAALASAGPYDLVIDYLWGRPTEALLASGALRDTRLVQVGEGAGPRISLPAGPLRGTGLQISGYGMGSAPLDVLVDGLAQLLARAGQLAVATDPVPLAEVEKAWDGYRSGRRTVLMA
jgi:NADPH2:quinone reductase